MSQKRETIENNHTIAATMRELAQAAAILDQVNQTEAVNTIVGIIRGLAGKTVFDTIGEAQTTTAGDSGQAVPPEGKCGCGAPDCVDNPSKTLYEAIIAEQLGVDTGDLHINDKGQVYIHGRLVGYAILRH